ncbi:hypothetical protein MXB_3003 [Myxobolus squamalis]|nr:hypothetical protein MXB_3003 [Myxobolus squamalis]
MQEKIHQLLVMKLVLGCNEFGKTVSKNDSECMIDNFLSENEEFYIDFTHSNGNSEEIPGDYVKYIISHGGFVSTKISHNDDIFVPEVFESYFKTRLVSLKAEYVDILYLQWPWKDLLLGPCFKKIDEFYKNGLFMRLGICNFPSWEVLNILNHCKSHNFVCPTTHRDVERTLIPCLREYGISFYACSPQAEGLISGSYEIEDKQRFSPETVCKEHKEGDPRCKLHKNRFLDNLYLDALEFLNNVPLMDRTLIQKSYDWLIHHSQLSSRHGDAIIISPNTLDQYEENFSAAICSVALPLGLVTAINAWYQQITGCVASFFR